MEKIYYYSMKYPEYGIKKIDVYGEVYTSTITSETEEKYLCALLTKYSISNGSAIPSKVPIPIDVDPEDEEIMYYEVSEERYLLSYNYYKIYKEWVKSARNRREKLNKSLRRLEQETMKERDIL